jgi:hypothetical protein
MADAGRLGLPSGGCVWLQLAVSGLSRGSAGERAAARGLRAERLVRVGAALTVAKRTLAEGQLAR